MVRLADGFLRPNDIKSALGSTTSPGRVGSVQAWRRPLKFRYGLEIRAATVADSAGLSALFGATGLTITQLTLAGRLDAIRQEQGAVLIAAEWGPPSGLIILHWYR